MSSYAVGHNYAIIIHLYEDGVRIWLCPSVCQKKKKYLLTSDTEVITPLQNFHLNMKARTKSYFGIHILDRCYDYCFRCFFELFPTMCNIAFISLQ